MHLIGREFERRQFKDLLDRNSSAIWPLYGAEGSGKSALLDELELLCGERDHFCLRLNGRYLQARAGPERRLGAPLLWLSLLPESASRRIHHSFQRISLVQGRQLPDLLSEILEQAAKEIGAGRLLLLHLFTRWLRWRSRKNPERDPAGGPGGRPRQGAANGGAADRRP